jgi:hypothetical protein
MTVDIGGKHMNTNPALADAARLIGDWQMDLYNAAFLPEPESRVVGSAKIDWIEDGSALVIRQGDPAHPPAAAWIIGRDEGEPDYLVLYADDRGVSRIYRMTLEGTRWEIWRVSPEFTQRFSAEIDPNGQVIRGQWSKSLDGGTTWEHDFNLDYVRSVRS